LPSIPSSVTEARWFALAIRYEFHRDPDYGGQYMSSARVPGGFFPVDPSIVTT